MNEKQLTALDTRQGKIFILDASKRCESSAFLFTRAVKFFLTNGYTTVNKIDNSEVIIVNTCFECEK